MNARLMICIPFHDRKRIVEQCLPTIVSAMGPEDSLLLCDDGSKEYRPEWLRQWSTSIAFSRKPIGVEAWRRLHLTQFWNLARMEITISPTHLLFLDSDAFVDPAMRWNLLRLQAESGWLLMCGYNTVAHSGMAGNTLEDDPKSEIIYRHYAPGICYLLTLEHVAKIMPHIENITNFDWNIPDILGGRCAISRTSYVDHIGFGGLRHPKDAGYDGGDRATNPTPFLVEKRREIVKKLEAQKP